LKTHPQVGPSVALGTRAAAAAGKSPVQNTHGTAAPANQAHAAPEVVKKRAPHQQGAVAPTRAHGDALVCVRHRQDAAGAFGYTTAELLVGGPLGPCPLYLFHSGQPGPRIPPPVLTWLERQAHRKHLLPS
jgi:hypothetical protein